ncbi:hypothetical protein GCM10009785_26420 [Brooklawnia cerclae]|uniref:Acyl-CoA thioester hydrolase n=1 Tax=Brooklawnia cerclae TaxID=349934 RepID=A0ABX0SKU2_9ACTN|nr:acyl-CoA thioesterase [Brooklawnia cerclae]NIH57352.1 acyl-CoA thioester hydrolase [Brooklawnia cerclae]
MTPFVTEVQIRWTDLDAQGHVNNVMVAEYLQEARVRFLLPGPAGTLLDNGCVVVGHQIAYRSPIMFDNEPLRVEVAVSELGAARFAVAYRVEQSGRTAVEARTTMCPFDLVRQTPRRLTADEHAFLAEWRVDAEPLRPLAAPVLNGRGTPLDVYTRWSDPDRYGHVNNVRFLDFALAGRVDMTSRADASMARVGMDNPDAVRWLIARQDIDYLAQLRYRLTPHRVLTAPFALGSTSISLTSEIIDPDDGTVCARARSVLVCADEQGSKRLLPGSARAALEALLVGT